jgi:hypothetical protein
MPPPIPQRTRNVYFLGAGFSRAVGLPNTAELLVEVHKLAQSKHLAIDRKLKDAYKFFYPEESDAFVPDVVDFFSVLRAYEDVSGSADGVTPRFPGGFTHFGLLTELRLPSITVPGHPPVALSEAQDLIPKIEKTIGSRLKGL